MPSDTFAEMKSYFLAIIGGAGKFPLSVMALFFVRIGVKRKKAQATDSLVKPSGETLAVAKSS
jgi:hypothetical protein